MNDFPPDPLRTQRFDPSDRPLGVTLLIWMFWFWAGAIVLLVLILVLGEGPVLVGGRSVSREETLASLLPALVPMALAVAGAALALSLARPWARAAALFPFALAAFGPLLTGVGELTAAGLGLTALVLCLIFGLLVRYLYFRPGPRSYFRPLPERDGGDRGDGGTGTP